MHRAASGIPRRRCIAVSHKIRRNTIELRNEKDARFIIRHHVTEEKLLHLEKGVRKLGFQSGGKRIMSIILGLFLLCMAAKVVIGGTIGDALMMIGILCAMGFVFGTYALLKG